MTNGEWYSGKHESAVTKDEFDRVQRMLGNNGKPIQRGHTFDLTGLFRCQQCGCALTATVKTKYYRRTNRYAKYIYYHCTKKSRHIICSQKPITEKKMNERIIEQLLTMQPPDDFVIWAKKWVSVLHRNESDLQEKTQALAHNNLVEIDARLNRLLDLYLNDRISETEYNEKKAELKKSRLELKRAANHSDEQQTNWRQKVENSLDFAKVMASRFEDGDRAYKHRLLIEVSSDLTYTSKKPLIHPKEVYEVIKKLNAGAFSTDVVARTSKYDDVFVERPDLVPANSTWLPR